MGIFKAARGSVSGVLADSWLESYSCAALPAGVLAQRASKQTSDRSSNTKGEENVISDSSTIIVNAGQCALAIDKGEVTDKGSINQRAVLEHRGELIEELYAANPSNRVISVG